MAGKIKVLAVHGVGRHAADGAWQTRWTKAMEDSLARADPGATLEVAFVSYDDVFSAESISLAGTLEAVGKLAGSGLWHGLGDLFGGPSGRSRARGRGLRDVPDRLRWTAGMVVQWAENERLRRSARRRVADAVAEHDPDVIAAHSLGSLVAYDAFSRSEFRDRTDGRTFVSFGSQLGNPFVRAQLGGRIEPLKCRHWYHLFNPHDDVFTCELRIPGDGFEQVDASFDIEGFADHDATHYLAHANVSDVVWADLTSPARSRRRFVANRRRLRDRAARDRRALLVGIDQYPEEDSRLEGCVNDVFLMSALLQESGFQPQDIRALLDHRATADGIRERLEWLLDGAGDGSERFFFYSGHGSQLTDYGVDETVDRKDECLVPYDFDWSRECAVTDDWFFELYSQLPYGVEFTVVMDCCHSGGMARAGVGRPKGLTPPDDIRHRELAWNGVHRMWEPRATVELERRRGDARLNRDFVTKTEARKLGAAVDLRQLSNARFNRARRDHRHRGPFMPVILQACQEEELAYEYRHGATSYGAFTYSMVEEIRGAGRRGIRFETLHERVRDRLRDLGYEQSPNLIGPPPKLRQTIRLGEAGGSAR